MFSAADDIKSGFDRAKEAIVGTTESVKGLEKGISVLDVKLGEVLQNVRKGLLSPGTIIADTSRLQDIVYEMTRTTMGQTKVIGDMLTDQMAQLWYETSNYGLTLEDNFALLESMNTIMKVNTFLSNEQAVNMGLLAKNAGITQEEMAGMVEGFDAIGIGTEEAISNISEMQRMARQYGLNVGEFMKGISSNIKTMSAYNFKDGAAGLAKMVAKAQALRIDMQNSVQFAEKLLSPEMAIETAASFQMIGGEVGELTDAFSLLNMAQNDVGGIQDAVLKAAETLVTVNRDTGDFEIVGGNLYKLRDMAEATGIGFQELSEMAIKSSKRTEKLDILGNLGKYDEDTQELIANLSNIDSNGRVTISLPDEDKKGQMKLYDATMLGQEELKKLRDIQSTKNLSDREIAEEQMSASRALAMAVDEKSRAIRVVMGTSTDGVMDVLEYNRETAQQALEDFEIMFKSENIERYGRTLTDALAKGFSEPETNELFKSAIGTIMSDMVSVVETADGKIKDRLDNSNVLKYLDLIDTGAVAFETAMSNMAGVFSGFSEHLESLGIPISSGLDLMSSSLSGFGDIILEELQDAYADLMFQEVDNTMRPPVVTFPASETESAEREAVEGVVTLNGDIRLNLGDTTLSRTDTNRLINELINNPEFVRQLMEIMNGDSEYDY